MEKVTSDPLKNVPFEERKKLSDLMKTLKFTKKSDLVAFGEHEEVKMLFDFLEASHIEALNNLGKYLRLLQKHEDTRQSVLFVEYYAAHTE